MIGRFCRCYGLPLPRRYRRHARYRKQSVGTQRFLQFRRSGFRNALRTFLVKGQKLLCAVFLFNMIKIHTGSHLIWTNFDFRSSTANVLPLTHRDNPNHTTYTEYPTPLLRLSLPILRGTPLPTAHLSNLSQQSFW